MTAATTPSFDLTGKIVLVTGAARGIGRATALACAGAGADMIVGVRKPKDGKALVAEIEALGRRALAVQMDLADLASVRKAVAKARKHFGRVDVLVNNVGAVRLRLEGFLGTSDEEFEWAMQMNFFTALRATRAALVPMLEQGGGAIVNLASVNSFFEPDAATIDYGAAKAALVNLSKSLAQEFGPQGVRVNCVSPGPVGTDLWLGEHGVAETVAQATGVDAETAREKVIAGIGGFATGRFTTPEEVATLITVLASEHLGNVTGANYIIDGGLIKTT
jgi:NAD(P)-dependent dehydrogenase (short-subunit alcohol dehydrogenase family)